MSINIKMWQVKDGSLENVDKLKLQNSNIFEKEFEDWIEKDNTILDNNILIIQRQYEGIDLLGVAYLEEEDEIEIVIIENKRDRASREVIAQVLDYASRIVNEKKSYFVKIAEEYYQRKNMKDSFKNVFRNKFGVDIDSENIVLREEVRLIVMAYEIDETTERIINFLIEHYDMNINAFSFSFFKNKNDEQFLVRNILMSEEQKEISGGRIKKGVSQRRVTLLNLINDGLISVGDEIVADYTGKQFKASISENGKIVFEGEEFESLSSAGAAVKIKCGRVKESEFATQGPAFWKYKDRTFLEIIEEYRQNKK